MLQMLLCVNLPSVLFLGFYIHFNLFTCLHIIFYAMIKFCYCICILICFNVFRIENPNYECQSIKSAFFSLGVST